LEEKHVINLKEIENMKNNMDDKLKQNIIIIENLNKSLENLTLSKQNELDSVNKQVMHLQEEREQMIKHQNVELATKDELINTLTNKLQTCLNEKQKQDLSNANLQAELTNESNKYQITAKDLQNQINDLQVKISSNNESFKKELELTNNEKEKTQLENLNLLEKLKSLENSKLNLQQKLIINENCKQDIEHLNEIIKDKSKIIDDNLIKIKQLDNLILQTKNKYEAIIKEKDEEIKELLKISEDNMNMKKFSLEENTKIILEEKNKENAILVKKIKDFENMEKSFEKQLEASESQKEDLKKLNEVVQDKIKTIENNNLKIEQLNNLVTLTKNDLENKLHEKDVQIKELSNIIEDKKHLEKQTRAALDEKDKDKLNLSEKINILENTNVNLEKQLENNKTQANIIIELQRSIEEKTKIIYDNNFKIKQLDDMIMLTNHEFNIKLKDKENKINELLKTEEEKLLLEKSTLVILDEKDREILNLVNILEETKLRLEKQLEISISQESNIIDLKKVIEEKTISINDNNLKIEQLDSLVEQIKEDFNVKLNIKENEVHELVKTWEDKLSKEKISFEIHIKTSLDEKDTEIELLKSHLNYLIKNNKGKEILSKLELVMYKLQNDKFQTTNLEQIKRELDKSLLEHNNKLEQLEISKTYMITDMTETIKNQQSINAELMAKIETALEILDDKKLDVQKEIDELKVEYSMLQTTLDEKNREIEQLKNSLQLKTDYLDRDEELNQLKVLL